MAGLAWPRERRRRLEADCIESCPPCQALSVELGYDTRVVDDQLEVRCGTTETRAESARSIGDVGWIDYQTMFHVDPEFRTGLEACSLVPAELPAIGEVLARWRGKYWELD